MSIQTGQRVRVTGEGEDMYVGRTGTVIGYTTEFFHVVLDGFNYLRAGRDGFDEPWHLFYAEELEAE